jgi:glucarate dehydratase
VDAQALNAGTASISIGAVRVPDRPGLGVTLDRERLAEAHELYVEHGLGARDDAAAMQYLVEDWSFDSKRPRWCAESRLLVHFPVQGGETWT